LGTTLVPGASCTVRITFTPSFSGARLAQLTFTASPGGGGSMALSGTGLATCPASSHNGGTGTCIALHLCSAGYHNSGTGNCVVNSACPAQQLTNDQGVCVNMAGVDWTPSDNARSWNSVAMSPDGATIVATAGSGLVPGLVYKSSDFGLHFTAAGSPGSGTIYLTFSGDGSALFGTNSSAVYRSVDSGSSWTTLANSPGHLGVVASSADGTRLAGILPEIGYESGTIYTSNDSGAHFAARPNSPSIKDGWIASSSDGSGLVLAGSGQNSGGANGVWTSSDYGATWTPRTPAPPINWAWTVASSSADGSHLAVAGNNSYVYTSADFGNTWTRRTSSGLDSWSGIASSADGSKLVLIGYSSGYYNLHISRDAGASWTLASPFAAQWRSVAISADGTRIAVVGSSARVWLSKGPVP
jgi:hypothetical protein